MGKHIYYDADTKTALIKRNFRQSSDDYQVIRYGKKFGEYDVLYTEHSFHWAEQAYFHEIQ